MKNADQIKDRVRDGKTEAADRAKEAMRDVREKAEDTVDSLKDRIHQLSRDR